jgi:hypothetical protein
MLTYNMAGRHLCGSERNRHWTAMSRAETARALSPGSGGITIRRFPGLLPWTLAIAVSQPLLGAVS